MPTQEDLNAMVELKERGDRLEDEKKELAHQFLRLCMILDRVGHLQAMPPEIRALYQKQLDALTARNIAYRNKEK